jgi:hypothetical protein
MQTEIQAAEQSLAETEQRLRLDADMLRMALELAENVAAVYATADEQTKRAYNQAFFKKLYVVPEWDEASSQTSARVSRAELTEPLRRVAGGQPRPNGHARGRADSDGRQHRRRRQPSAAFCCRVFDLRETDGDRGTKIEHFRDVATDRAATHRALRQKLCQATLRY